MKRLALVFVWLAAVVLANLSSATFGPVASIYNAFFLIGLSLTTRDALHNAWHNEGLKWKMAALIATGSALSYLINHEAARIALASCIALALAESVDALVYHALRKRQWLEKSNGSNIPAAAIDSLVFPTIAFGGFLPLITLGQFLAKVLGGFLWSLLIGKVKGAALSNPRGQNLKAV